MTQKVEARDQSEKFPALLSYLNVKSTHFLRALLLRVGSKFGANRDKKGLIGARFNGEGSLRDK